MREVGGRWGVGMGVQNPSQRGAKAAAEEDRAVSVARDACSALTSQTM